MIEQTKPTAKVPAKNGYKYKPQWGVLIHCKDEKHQQSIYELNKSKGLKCKVVSL